ncbi:hypothetical protein [Streptomyces sp. V4I2]|uniref:hypothetical protein n=1 Tax=Streptomyces sp. V4I2 TaxID=3042280 RepID=UPI00278B66EB|nr:hypothetical protein [Streptomyces sp. V4I2]MDQ1045694.1 hypothetical protein [Streptomyces sp. V4I2]
MKSLKAAVIAAGSLVMAGFATPALALDGAGVKPADLGGAVNNVKGVKVGGGRDGPARFGQGPVAQCVQKATGGLGKQGNIQLVG